MIELNGDIPTEFRLTQLNKELEPLDLPDFNGTEWHSERRGDEEERQKPVPYIVVRCDSISESKLKEVIAVVKAHRPKVEVSRAPELRVRLKDDTITFDELKELMRLELHV